MKRLLPHAALTLVAIVIIVVGAQVITSTRARDVGPKQVETMLAELDEDILKEIRKAAVATTDRSRNKSLREAHRLWEAKVMLLTVEKDAIATRATFHVDID